MPCCESTSAHDAPGETMWPIYRVAWPTDPAGDGRMFFWKENAGLPFSWTQNLS